MCINQWKDKQTVIQLKKRILLNNNKTEYVYADTHNIEESENDDRVKEVRQKEYI